MFWGLEQIINLLTVLRVYSNKKARCTKAKKVESLNCTGTRTGVLSYRIKPLAFNLALITNISGQSALLGGKSQAVRARTLALFKDSANAAIDISARFIHIYGISLVVQVDVP
jgi:superfamily II DNA/RNA helicase